MVATFLAIGSETTPSAQFKPPHLRCGISHRKHTTSAHKHRGDVHSRFLRCRSIHSVIVRPRCFIDRRRLIGCRPVPSRLRPYCTQQHSLQRDDTKLQSTVTWFPVPSSNSRFSISVLPQRVLLVNIHGNQATTKSLRSRMRPDTIEIRPAKAL